MQLTSDSFAPGQPFPERCAMGRRDGDAAVLSANRNPHLAWSGVPSSARSLALLCVDPDAPTVAAMVGQPGIEIPVDQPRTEFVHWVMIDIPPDVREIAEGAWADGVVAHGKADPKGPHAARHGLNDYTGWFAGDPAMRGDYRGYDGPFPPPNDLRTHRYFFRLFALDVEALDVPDRFTAADVLRAMQGHVFAEALAYGTYSLHAAPR